MVLESRSSPDGLAILVVGTDTVIEALPAGPIQLANACGALGFDLTIPLSWGDELVAEAALRTLESRGRVPALLCSCPMVRQRLLQAGSELADTLVSLVSSPVAVARHLRATLGARVRSISYVGGCPGASAPEFDRTYDPQEFFALLRDRGVEIRAQPDVFLDTIPPDRRRFTSLPGGCPTPDLLWQRCHEMTLVEVDGADLSVEIAQHLLSPHSTLIDPGPAVGCACSGVTRSTTGLSVRVAVTSLEPPRSLTPVVSNEAGSDLNSEPLGARSGDARKPNSGRPPMAVTPPSALGSRVLKRQ